MIPIRGLTREGLRAGLTPEQTEYLKTYEGADLILDRIIHVHNLCVAEGPSVLELNQSVVGAWFALVYLCSLLDMDEPKINDLASRLESGMARLVYFARQAVTQ